jgi:hypothetical protein
MKIITITITDTTDGVITENNKVFDTDAPFRDAIEFLETEYVQSNPEMVLIASGAKIFDNIMFDNRLIYFGLKVGELRFQRLLCQGNTVKQVVLLCPEITRSAVDSETGIFTKRFGKYTAAQRIKIFTCTIPYFNLSFHDAIQDFQKENDVTYIKRGKLLF